MGWKHQTLIPSGDQDFLKNAVECNEEEKCMVFTINATKC